jgi:AcrR family transcriptional regulator
VPNAVVEVDAPNPARGGDTPPKLGRKRDVTRDPEILESALDVLAETGYAGMTIDMVAKHAKAGKATIYRRWPSKAELIIDAVSCMGKKNLPSADLPDTGTLRGDLIALIKPHTIEEGDRKFQIMAGVLAMISQAPELAEAANTAIIQPRVQANLVLMRRAIDRGEISPECDIHSLSLVTPAMIAHRILILRTPINREFLISLIDSVLLPAVGLPRH